MTYPLRRPQHQLAARLFLFSILSSTVPEMCAPATAAEQPRPVADLVLNVRDYGAVGDGSVHLVREWIRDGRFRSLAALQTRYPFVDTLDWSVDEAAFTAALADLPAAGGTIHFPTGRYVAAKHPWKIWRDNVRLTGDGPDRTILATAPNVAEGLSLAPYRHVGWLEGAENEYPLAADTGGRGETCVQLVDPQWTREFQRGELVFIRCGANRFDQDYGEFNEVAGSDSDGGLRFKYPFARDYTLAKINWGGETAAEFLMPAAGQAVRVAFRTGEGYVLPSPGTTVSVGTNLFTVGRADAKSRGAAAQLPLTYRGRGDSVPGTLFPAGTRIAKSRAILKVTRTTRNFRCENLQVVGRRKAANLSNSYNSSFSDCAFVRDARAGGFTGGLTIDGDGGRFARFERCTITATPAAGMQFARSFGSVVFSGCTFVDANVAFTEFNFDCEVSRCTFDITGGHGLSSVIIAGKSCGEIRLLNNRIRAAGVVAILDTHSDIQSQKHGSEGEIVVRANTIETDAPVKLVAVPKSDRLAVEDNIITTR